MITLKLKYQHLDFHMDQFDFSFYNKYIIFEIKIIKLLRAKLKIGFYHCFTR